MGWVLACGYRRRSVNCDENKAVDRGGATGKLYNKRFSDEGVLGLVRIYLTVEHVNSLSSDIRINVFSSCRAVNL